MSTPVETLQVARPPLDKTMDCSYPGKRGGGGQELSFLLLFTCLLSFGLYQLGLIGSLSQRTIPTWDKFFHKPREPRFLLPLVLSGANRAKKRGWGGGCQGTAAGICLKANTSTSASDTSWLLQWPGSQREQKKSFWRSAWAFLSIRPSQIRI